MARQKDFPPSRHPGVRGAVPLLYSLHWPTSNRDSETIGLLSPTVLARYGKVGAGAPSFLGFELFITIRSPHPIPIGPKTDAPGWVWGFFFNYARQEECCYRRNGLIGFADFRGEFANCGCQAKDILLDPRSDVSSEKNARSKQSSFSLSRVIPASPSSVVPLTSNSVVT